MKFAFLLIVLVCLCLAQVAVADKVKSDISEAGEGKKVKKSGKVVNFEEGTIPEPPTGDDDKDEEDEDESKKKKKVERKGFQSRFNRPIDDHKVDKAWEEGDDEADLENEYELQRKVASKVQQRRGMDFSDPKKLAKLAKDPLAFVGGSGGGSAAMFFVEIRKKQSNGRKWNKKAVDALAMKWTSLLKSGSLPATCVSIGEKEEEPRFLVNVDKAWMSTETIKFILVQKETVKVTSEQKDYTRKDFGLDVDEDDDDDDDEL